MSDKITHFSLLLAEAGQPVKQTVAQINGIKDRLATLDKQRDALVKSLHTAEDSFMSRLTSQWDFEEIRKAQIEFKEKYQDDLVLEGQGIHYDAQDSEIFRLPDGRKITIGRYDLGFVYNLRKLPVQTKASIIHLTPLQIHELLKEKEKELRKECIDLLNTEWTWRETGDSADFTDSYTMDAALQIPLTKAALITKIQKQRVSIPEMERIIKYFTKDFSEVKTATT